MNFMYAVWKDRMFEEGLEHQISSPFEWQVCFHASGGQTVATTSVANISGYAASQQGTEVVTSDEVFALSLPAPVSDSILPPGYPVQAITLQRCNGPEGALFVEASDGDFTGIPVIHIDTAPGLPYIVRSIPTSIIWNTGIHRVWSIS